MNIIYPGSFDPLTHGHRDIVEQAVKIFGKVTILVMTNPDKKHMFDINQRAAIAKRVILVHNTDNVTVEQHTGTISSWLEMYNDETIIVRGLRNNIDFDYEMQYETFTKAFGAQTVYLTPDPQYIFTSSSLVRNLIKCGGDVDQYMTWDDG